MFVASLMCFGACGGSSSPSAATPTSVAIPDPTALATGTTLSVVSGENGQAVGGAKIVMAGRPYEADAGGQVTLAERVPFGSLVDVIAPGFLDRQSLIRAGTSGRFVLWPRTTTSGVDEAYTVEIVYTAGTDPPPPSGTSPLERLRLGTTQAFVVVSDEIRGDDQANSTHESAVATLNTALAGQVVYALVPTRPQAGVIFDAKVDPADRECDGGVRAYSLVRLQSGEITGGRVVYCNMEVAQSSTVAHELGHTVGLNHSPDDHELMFRFFSRRRSAEFGPRERLMMALLLERRGGNRFPDNDRDVPAGATGTFTIVCR
jgi:hypothetical protein